MRYCTLLLALITMSATAEVTDQADSGFSVSHQMTTSADPQQLYDLLINDVRHWWNAEHSYTGDGDNLRIEARAGGCFCEQLPGGSMQHMAIVYAERGKLLRMYGGLGPLQTIAASGPLDWKIEPHDDGARLTVTYHVAGYLKDGLQTWAAPVDGVIKEQVVRLIDLANRTTAGAPAK